MVLVKKVLINSYYILFLTYFFIYLYILAGNHHHLIILLDHKVLDFTEKMSITSKDFNIFVKKNLIF